MRQSAARRHSYPRALLGCLLIGLAASFIRCNPGDRTVAAAGGDAGTDASDAGPFVTAPHQAFPQMPSHGGTAFSRLQLVTVTFQGYPFRQQAESFGDFVVGSEYLKQTTREYGLTSAVHLAKVVLPPLTDPNPDFASILTQALDAGTLPFPADPAGLLYLFYAPPPCDGGRFAGFHRDLDPGDGGFISYAVAFNCNDGSAAVGVASHEIIEAVTDPLTTLADAGVGVAWEFGVESEPWEGEVADVCEASPWAMEGGFTLAPGWSNSAAADGGSPCVPFDARIAYMNVSSAVTKLDVSAGGSATVRLTGWSTAPTGFWPVDVILSGRDFDPEAVLSSGTISNGTSVDLIVHVPETASLGSGAIVEVRSTFPVMVNGVSGFSSYWPILITVR